MKTTAISIKNMFTIKELKLEGKNYEICGKSSSGKTNILEAVRLALANKTNKDIILRRGEEEGEVQIETDTGIIIRRRERVGKERLNTIKENKANLKEADIRELFSPLQLNPVEFLSMPAKEQNRMILGLIDFKWDLNWIKEQFGEIPEGVDYEQHILEVLADIQSSSGRYYSKRENINRDIRNKTAIIEDIAEGLPENYQAAKWSNISLKDLYSDIAKIKHENNQIEKAKAVIDSQENKMRGFAADREIALNALDQEISGDRTRCEKEIMRLEQELKAERAKLDGLGQKEVDRKEKIELEYKAAVAKFESSLKENKKIASSKPKDFSDLSAEADHAEKMKNLIPEYNRMVLCQEEIDQLTVKAQGLTEKIEKARTLPGEILEQAKLPLPNLTIVNGEPLFDGLPISNMGDGEKMNLCVDIASLKENPLKLLLVDGAEKLSDELRTGLYTRCKERGIQFISTRTTNDNELMVVEV